MDESTKRIVASNLVVALCGTTAFHSELDRSKKEHDTEDATEFIVQKYREILDL